MQQEKSLIVILVLLSLVIGFTFGIIFYNVIPHFWGKQTLSYFWSQSNPLQKTVIPDSLPPEKTEKLDAVTLQLIERVRDSSSYFTNLLTLLGIIATILATALGVSIWKTHIYSKRLVDEQVKKFKDDDLPRIQRSFQSSLDNSFSNFRSELNVLSTNSRSELENITNNLIQLITEGLDIQLDSQFFQGFNLYKNQLSIAKLSADVIKRKLKDKEKSYQLFKKIVLYLLLTLSKDEGIVQDMCQKLSALTEDKKEAIIANADFILKHLYLQLPYWQIGNPTRLQIQNLIERIKKLKKTES